MESRSGTTGGYRSGSQTLVSFPLHCRGTNHINHNRIGHSSFVRPSDPSGVMLAPRRLHRDQHDKSPLLAHPRQHRLVLFHHPSVCPHFLYRTSPPVQNRFLWAAFLNYRTLCLASRRYDTHAVLPMALGKQPLPSCCSSAAICRPSHTI